MNYVPPPNKQHYYEQVWAQVQQVPYGKVATYDQIAKMLPRPNSVSAEDYQMSASRWVGLAMAVCTDEIPWQRVVNSQGKISHPEAGKQIQRLESEGVFFVKGKVNLNDYQWREVGEGDEPTQGRLF